MGRDKDWGLGRGGVGFETGLRIGSGKGGIAGIFADSHLPRQGVRERVGRGDGKWELGLSGFTCRGRRWPGRAGRPGSCRRRERERGQS